MPRANVPRYLQRRRSGCDMDGAGRNEGEICSLVPWTQDVSHAHQRTQVFYRGDVSSLLSSLSSAASTRSFNRF